ncbi:hypothetical protein J2T14_001383 [Paenibacillus harenae]|nr:hypothetical protein [Paenibacillus harenae]
METHINMHNQGSESAIWLYIAGLIFIIAIVSYVLAARKNKESANRMKKEARNVLKQTVKKFRLAGHLLIVVALILVFVHYLPKWMQTYDVAELNYDMQIEVKTDEYFGADHTDSTVNYEMKIPTSGPHSPHDLKFGFYNERPAFEMLVHNLEHGDIIIHYRPSVTHDQVTLLQYLAKFREAGAGVLAVPNDELPEGAELVVTAWTKTMELDGFNERAVAQFIYDNINRGPEQIPANIRQGGGTM